MAKVVHLAEGVRIPYLEYYATDVEMVELNELFDAWARRHEVLDESEQSKLGPQKVKFLATLEALEGYRSVHTAVFESGHSSAWFTVENPLAGLLAKARELDPSSSRLRLQPAKIEVELPWTRIEAVTQILGFPGAAAEGGSPCRVRNGGPCRSRPESRAQRSVGPLPPRWQRFPGLPPREVSLSGAAAPPGLAMSIPCGSMKAPNTR